MLQAVLYDTPNARFKDKEEIPVLACVIRCIAKNQRVRGSLVLAKIVPLVTEV